MDKKKYNFPISALAELEQDGDLYYFSSHLIILKVHHFGTIAEGYDNNMSSLIPKYVTLAIRHNTPNKKYCSYKYLGAGYFLIALTEVTDDVANEVAHNIVHAANNIDSRNLPAFKCSAGVTRVFDNKFMHAVRIATYRQHRAFRNGTNVNSNFDPIPRNIHGQIIYDAVDNKVRMIELLGRPVGIPPSEIESYFMNLAKSETFEWAYTQSVVADMFYNQTGIRATVNIDADILTSMKWSELENYSVGFEITQVKGIPPLSELEKVKAAFPRLTIILDDYTLEPLYDIYGNPIPLGFFDAIKFDKSVFQVDDYQLPYVVKLVSDIVKQAKSRKQYIVAEGVETEEQLRVVLSCGIRYIQGYYYHKPELIHRLEEKMFVE